MVRERKRTEAIAYAKRHLTAWMDTHGTQIQRAMALLAFPPQTRCGQFKELYDPSRWRRLVEQFRTDHYALNALTGQSMLTICMQAGMMALKTHYCYEQANKNVNCPICNEHMNALAQRLPYSQRMNSCIVCRISGKIMDEDNPPMVLPNGNVYSLQALEEMAATQNGKVTDPRTNQQFAFASAKKAFLA